VVADLGGAGLYIAGNMKWGWKDAAKAYEEGMNNG
jgi:hypothetical protein